MVIFTKFLTYPSTKRRLGFAQINCHIEYAPSGHANEFPLWLPDLIMQAAQHAARGTGLVVLNEFNFQFNFVPECMGVPSFQEKAAFVSEYKRFQEQNIWDFCTNHLHGHSRRYLRVAVANSDHIHSSRAVRRALPAVRCQ